MQCLSRYNHNNLMLIISNYYKLLYVNIVDIYIYIKYKMESYNKTITNIDNIFIIGKL